MSSSLILAGFKAALRTCDCLTSTPLWENTADCKKFLESGECDQLTWTIHEEYINRMRERGCDNVRIRGFFRIRIYTPAGHGTHEARDATDCFLCCVKQASNQVFTDTDGKSVRLVYSHGLSLPSAGPAGFDEFGRSVRIVNIPYDAFTCDC